MEVSRSMSEKGKEVGMEAIVTVSRIQYEQKYVVTISAKKIKGMLMFCVKIFQNNKHQSDTRLPEIRIFKMVHRNSSYKDTVHPCDELSEKRK